MKRLIPKSQPKPKSIALPFTSKTRTLLSRKGFILTLQRSENQETLPAMGASKTHTFIS